MRDNTLPAPPAAKRDPPSLFKAVLSDTVELAAGFMRTFGSAGKAG
jgi:hypothetical protein